MIKGFTFGWDARKGDFRNESAQASLATMVEETAANTVIFAMAALQDTAHSIHVDFTGKHMVDDDELIDMIHYAKSLGLKVFLKPTVNVRNGVWRAHINFFDKNVPGEPTWDQWFESYTQYQCHYAQIAEQTQCDMLVIGCEMVQSEKRDHQWRQLIAEVRGYYHGQLTYNTDKYQEDQVSFWDALDVISSSGYYPIHDWKNQLDRIEKVVLAANKPFFFVEAGCMSRKDASLLPNNWEIGVELSLEEQATYYAKMFEMAGERAWMGGFGMWDWEAKLYPKSHGEKDMGYGVYGKPVAKVIKAYYQSV